jgi:hypothetical protein
LFNNIFNLYIGSKSNDNISVSIVNCAFSSELKSDGNWTYVIANHGNFIIENSFYYYYIYIYIYISFLFILFYFILFYFILFYFILFYFIIDDLFKGLFTNLTSNSSAVIFDIANTSSESGYHNISGNTFISIKTNKSAMTIIGSFSSLTFSYNSFFNVNSSGSGGVLKIIKFTQFFFLNIYI